ncbi:hypothetical protein B1J92_G00286g [Nakaseomyces glabratus]|nr:X8 domain [Nakaseomyces glabratus]KAH7602129.1 X8 domain [Nakaseomyces glabratus]KAH7613519.1 X8 domain [Nakaseomyces glabratus]KAI8397558.1 X8 domain [Nakaseomyces glabratus]KAJ9570049.1 1,3-beta-glucanosyltransferase [Nakaseomyces glabratus]
MQYSLVSFITAATLLLSSVVADDLPAIEIKGNKFFFSNNGSQFYMKGIAYQADTANVTGGATINDPLADWDTCSRDIPYLQQLATNVIRVYAVNTSLDHSRCMNALNDAGIYVIADLSSPKVSVNRKSPSWDLEIFDRYKSVVDMFANYSNVLGFFAGNEVTNDATNTDASAFVKAAIRDTKSYIKEKGYRGIPVGYSSNDDADTRVDIADYFACGDDAERADFYGINMYEWCGNSTFQKSGYADRTKEFANLSIPLFFSEYGCNEVQPREFTEVQALYGPDMTDVWSGGIVYMYFQEANNYGLVSIDGSSVKTLEDFNYYSKEIHSISPSSVNSKTYTPTATSLACPSTNQYWKAATNLPPTPQLDLCECMDAANSCIVQDDVDEDDYQDLFSYLCGKIDCGGITGNGTTGKYGSYSFCSPKEKLNFVLNLYYNAQGGSKSNCDFSGSATLRSGTTQAGCASALKEIGSVGTNSATDSVTFSGGSTGTSKASATGSNSSKSGSSKSGSSTSSSAKSSSSGKSNKKSNSSSSVQVGLYQLLFSAFITLGAVAGAGFALI